MPQFFAQTIQAELARPAKVNEIAFPLTDFACCRRQRGHEFSRYGKHSMLVGDQYVAGLNEQAADFYRLAVIDDMRVGVGWRNVAGEYGQAEFSDRRQIPNGAVGDRRDTVERLENRRGKLANAGAGSGIGVHVLDNNDPRTGHTLEVAPPLVVVDVGAAEHRRIG